MPFVYYLLVAAAVIVFVLLLIVLVLQVRNSRHMESLKEGVKSAENAPKKEMSKPKVMKGAQPAKGIKAVRSSGAAAAAEKAPEPAEAVEPPAPVVPEAVEQAAVEAIAVEVPSAPPAEAAEAAPEFIPDSYPEFSNARAVELLGLSQEEADMFVAELITQIGEEMPALEAAAAAGDMEKLENVSHKLKGSATSLGEGGVADVLVAFNTYCKEGDDAQTVARHMANLRFYFDNLKVQFPA